jgi:hypothetical protein
LEKKANKASSFKFDASSMKIRAAGASGPLRVDVRMRAGKSLSRPDGSRTKGRTMGFLIKSAFWLSLVLLFIPFDAVDGGQKADTVSPVIALQAAREAASDIGNICARKPEVCTVGQEALHTIGVRARAGARLAYEMLDKHTDRGDAGLTTGSIASAEKPAR